MAAEEEALRLGSNSAGSNCVDKVFDYSGKGALAGGFYGVVEACFLPTVALSQPIFIKSVTLAVGRCMLGGIGSGLFAASACLSASIRDQDDYKNAVVGGAVAGTVFGFASRSIPVCLCASVGLATVFGAIKYMHGDYLPSLPSQKATTQAPDYSYTKARPKGQMNND